jgi:hypothetical protein
MIVYYRPMSYQRAKYEFPIEGIARHRKADAPAGIYLLDGAWHLAAHDSLEEFLLVERGALLVATLTFSLPARITEVAPVSAISLLCPAQFMVS